MSSTLPFKLRARFGTSRRCSVEQVVFNKHGNGPCAPSYRFAGEPPPKFVLPFILEISLTIHVDALRIMQAFFTRCLDVFSSNEMFVVGPVNLRLETLNAVAQHCAERVRIAFSLS